MQAVLLIDFGSTYTKLTAVDLDAKKIFATAQDFTTVDTDVMEGFERALLKLKEKTGDIPFEKRLACSSAAGGLRMVACGLVPALTAKAAKLAAFGAGAKVIKTYSYKLTRSDIQEIDQIAPEILLLTGGTDGGNQEVIEHNASMLAKTETFFPVVYAGNHASGDICRDILESEKHPFYLCENVMPRLNKLNIQPAQGVIRKIFLDRIISAKGLSKQKALIDGILMPTPAAVLAALTLLSKGTSKHRGIGELMACDLGGATTDIYSIARGAPTRELAVVHGLPEPFSKRTVEGDIGMRYSAHGVVEAVGIEEIARIANVHEDVVYDWLNRIDQDKSILPATEEEKVLDFALAAGALRTGIIRHSGTLEMVYTPVGAVYQQQGKDLSEVKLLIMTGGALNHTDQFEAIGREALAIQDTTVLAPTNPRIICDTQYVLSALGLLSTIDPETAFELLNNIFGKEDSL